MRILRAVRVASAVCLAWGVVSSTGCAPDEASFGRQSTVLLEGDVGGGDGGGADGEGVRHGAPLDDAPRAPSRTLLAAFDDEGRVVLVDPIADEVLERRAVDPELEAVPTDLVLDRFGGRLLVVVMPPPFEESEILAVPLEGERLGVPVRLGWVTGEARVMPIAGGVVVASNADGPRVRLMRDDGERTLGRSLPEPLSWWLDADGERIEGLGAESGDELVRFSLQVDAEGSIAIRDRVDLGLLSEGARLVRGRTVTTASGVRTSPDDLIVHDDETGEIARVDVDGGSPTVLMHRARAVQGAGRWDDALVVTTTHPDAMVVRTHGEEAVIELLEGVVPATPFGRHDLATADGRLFVATRAGIVAFLRTEGDDPVDSRLEVERDWTFHGKRLRGPMVTFVP